MLFTPSPATGAGFAAASQDFSGLPESTGHRYDQPTTVPLIDAPERSHRTASNDGDRDSTTSITLGSGATQSGPGAAVARTVRSRVRWGWQLWTVRRKRRDWPGRRRPRSAGHEYTRNNAKPMPRLKRRTRNDLTPNSRRQTPGCTRPQAIVDSLRPGDCHKRHLRGQRPFQGNRTVVRI